MSQRINRYQADLRELRFVLLEQFELGQLLGREPYEDWGEEEIRGVLAEAYRYATEVAGPLNAVGDQEGCRLEDGEVRVPSGFKEAFQQLYAGGFKSLGIPAEYGGASAPKALSVIVNELTSGANPALDIYAALTVGAADVIEAFGTDEQRQRYCPQMYDGSWAGTMCLTEPQAGSDVGETTTTATKNGDGTYSIRGTKVFISGGGQDMTDNIVHMVLARTPGAPRGTRGLSLFIVPKRRPDGSDNDVRVSSIEHKMGLNGSATCVLNFGDEGGCRGELVGEEENRGMRQMFQMMNFARISVGVQGLAAASSAYLNALQYARERKQGASIEQAGDVSAPRISIVEHPDVRRSLLEMKAKVEGTRAMVVKAAWHYDCAQHSPPDQQKYHLGQIELLTPLIKAYGSDQGFAVSHQAIQVFGGAGYTKDHPVEQYCRDARVFAIYEGTNHIQALDLVGRKLMLDSGQHGQAFLADAKGFVERHRAHERLGDAIAELDAALGVVKAVVTRLAGWASTEQRARVGLIASPLLNLMSETCVAWLLLDAGVKAAEALASLPSDHPDADFYQGKIDAAEYFATWVLPVVARAGEVLLRAPVVPLRLSTASLGRA